MSTTLSLRVVCDEKRSPGCLGEHVQDVVTLSDLDRVQTQLWQEGWVRGYRGLEVVGDQTHDACPACAALRLVPKAEDAG